MLVHEAIATVVPSGGVDLAEEVMGEALVVEVSGEAVLVVAGEALVVVAPLEAGKQIIHINFECNE